MRPGDLWGFETTGMFATLIRVKQRMIAAGGAGYYLWRQIQRLWKGKPEWPWWTRVTHIALVSELLPPCDGDGNDAWVIQAVRRVNEVGLNEDYGNTPKHLIPLPAHARKRAHLAVKWASKRIGVEYGLVQIASLALNTLTPECIRIDFTKAGSLICSGLGACAWQQAGVDLGVDVDPNQVTPGQLAAWFGEAP